MKAGSGVKMTTPPETVYVPSPATVRVVCCPGVSGSRSIVLGSKLKAYAMSFDNTLIVTGVFWGVVAVSSLATGL